MQKTQPSSPLAIARHYCFEIRGPLGAILATAEVLEEKIPGPLNSDQVGLLQAIIRNTNHLDNLLREMFEFQFSQAGQVDLQPGPFDFWSTCDAVKAEVLPAALAKGVQFRWSVEATGGACHVDGDKLNRSVVNLLKIAVDRAPAGETVHLSLTESDQDLEVLITGSGVQGAALSGEANPQETTTEEPTNEMGGLDMGLYLSRVTIEAHGGELRQGTSPEGGHEFRIRVPKVCPEQPENPFGAKHPTSQGERAAG